MPSFLLHSCHVWDVPTTTTPQLASIPAWSLQGYNLCNLGGVLVWQQVIAQWTVKYPWRDFSCSLIGSHNQLLFVTQILATKIREQAWWLSNLSPAGWQGLAPSFRLQYRLVVNWSELTQFLMASKYSSENEIRSMKLIHKKGFESEV